ncbi:general transcription factor II-I repeat domain-containing protein 2-like [Oratosquilla oratoria]|uniref:general transcription factor II-I repeat domain-containing protein 2-like n=1 Tax=Oratosquilla oratoria TaxID=337810 RepID=UPI003F76B355
MILPLPEQPDASGQFPLDFHVDTRFVSFLLIMSATQRVKKRKMDLEHRTFNPEWEKYFLIKRFGQAQCLICLKTVAVLKEYNVRRHWGTGHRSSNFASMSAAERKDAIVRLLGNLQKQTSLFRKQNAEAEKVTRASYEVSYILDRRMKPFAEGDFIKECLLAVVDSVCPEQCSAFESVGLSSHTVRRRIEGMSDNVHDSLKTRISNFVAFSLALNESTETKDTTQMAVFLRGVTADLQVCEEFLQLVPLRGTTTGQDICDAVLQCVDQHSLDLSRLVCVTTDGAPAMVGEKKGAASLLVRHCEAAGYTQPINMMHCIIHQESLCAKSANLVDVMSVVVKVVNSILSRSLNHRQFQVLMDEVNVHYNDLLYFCEVRWLSRGAMLSRLCDLQQEIATFLRQKNLPHADQFSDPQWLARLALLTDITRTSPPSRLSCACGRFNWLLVSSCIFLALLLVPLTTWTWTLAFVQVMCWSLFTLWTDVKGEDKPRRRNTKNLAKSELNITKKSFQNQMKSQTLRVTVINDNKTTLPQRGRLAVFMG